MAKTYYIFDFINLDIRSILNVIKGALAGGCWLYIQNIQNIDNGILAVISQMVLFSFLN